MIREMTKADLPIVHKIEMDSFSVPWSMESMEDELRNNKAHYIVLVIEDRVVGYAGFWKILDEGHITNLAIDASMRGQGLGKVLALGMMDLARTLDIKQMTLEVRESNKAALKVYEHVGFYIKGRRSRYYINPSEDALIMWASLEQGGK